MVYLGLYLPDPRLQDISLSVHSAMETAASNLYEVLVPRKSLAEVEMQALGC